ncbi:MAG: DUF2141 domain-containing protein [Kordiimonadaceae bacterium]|nr:DUF2141 domain-containing protein [Kordiimonadaceae bacterium]
MMATNGALADELNIRVTGIQSDRGGVLSVMMFGKDGYPKKHAKALEIKSVPADQNEIFFVFTTDRDHVAVKAHHDEDGDMKVTKNWTGIYPAEGLGFSNKRRVTLTGPPSYNKSKVSRADFGQTLEIALRYGRKKKK